MLDSVYLMCAIVGGGIFVLRTLLMFVGLGDGELMGDHSDLDAAGAHSDADLGFRILSLQSLTAFFMMFGLTGLMLLREAHLEALWSLPVSTAAGAASVWLIGRLFRAFSRLQSSGTLATQRAVGARGVVYLGIRKGRPGKVQVEFAGRLRVLDAQAEGDLALPTGTEVRVLRVMAGDVLVVEPLTKP